MAASITLNVSINKAEAEAGLKAINKSIKPLTTPVKLNIDTKGALSSLKDLNTIASNLEKTLQKAGASGLLADKIKNGYASKNNVFDEAIRQAETASKNYAAAIKQQMQAEQEAAQSRRGLVSEMNAWDQAIHANEASGKAFSAALKQQMQAEQEAAREAKKAGQAAKQAGEDAKTGGQEAAESANGWSVLGGAVATALGHLASRAVSFALQKLTQGIREALTTMKDVDKELANIQKVTGESDDVISRLGDTAYDTASKYGIAANDFLSASADFAKAGYDNYDAMAELATKTQLVGDVSADVASKFLLSADAAFKFGGDIGKLSTVLDKANVIENNYATSIEKLADGFPIVANTAAMANMSIDETMAAIGTITAVTQESGPMAARALRALILNILKDTTTEVEDGVTVTTDQIKSLQDALNKYAPDVVKAAEATGKIIDPMEAIGALSKAWEEGLLSEQELAAMVTDIGGKLRTNQLLALIKNFDMFNEMLGKSKESAGSADKEIEIMLGTWEAKTNQLKNSWTKFISDLVDTDAIKGGVDMLRGLVEGLDGLVGKATNPFYDSDKINHEIGDTEEKIKSLTDAIAELKSSGSYDSATLKNLEYELQIQEKILELKQKQYKLEHEEEAQKLQNRLTAANPYFDAAHMAPELATTDGAQMWSLSNAIGNVQFENVSQYQEALRGITSDTKDYYEQVKTVREVLGDGALTDAQRDFISLWEEADSAASASGLHMDGFVDGVDGLTDGYIRLVDAQGNVIAYARNTVDVIQDQIDAIDEQNSADEVRADVVDDLIQKQQELAEAQQAFDEASDPGERAKAYAELDAAQMAYFDSMREASDAELAAAAEATAGAGELETAEAGATDEAQATADAAGEIAGKVDAATASTEKLEGAARSAAAAFTAISLGPMGGLLGGGFATGTTNAPGGPTLVNEIGPELISENGRAYIANGGKPGVVNLSKGAIVLTARQTKEALRGGNGAVKSMHAAALGQDKVVVTTTTSTGVSPYYYQAQSAIAAYNNALNYNKGTVYKGYNKPIGWSEEDDEGKDKKGKPKGTPSGGGSPSKSIEDIAKETKDILSNLDKQAKLADNRKQYDKEASLYTQAQKEIDKMIAAYKKAGYKETDDEILDLLNKRYDYEKKKETASQKSIKEAADELKDKLSNIDKQAKLADSQQDYAKEVQFYEQAQEAIKKMVERYRAAGYKDDSTEIVELLNKNVEYAEKQVKLYQDRWKDLIDALEDDTAAQEAANKLAEKEQALADAREALANATGQRTVRTYNAATGQWEWVADQSRIKSAQDALSKAEDDYKSEVKDQAISEIERISKSGETNLSKVILGPALSTVMAMAENSDEFQRFAAALNAVYGVGSYLNSTQGSSKVISTSGDSHDTYYTFGDVTLSAEQAQSMTVAELAQKLQVLKIS